MQWGFSVNRARTIDMDKNDMMISKRILKKIPSLQSCIACGNCVATCPAGALTTYNFRKTHTLLRRAEYTGLLEELSKCMMCGKCVLSCPRGINTRAVITLIKQELGEHR